MNRVQINEKDIDSIFYIGFTFTSIVVGEKVRNYHEKGVIRILSGEGNFGIIVKF